MTAVQALLDHLSLTTSAEPHSSGELLTTPFFTTVGHPIQVYVEQLSDDAWFVSDLGATAGELALSGVDLDKQAVRASWQALSNAMAVTPPVLRQHVGEFELAGMAGSDDLGRAIASVAESVLRGEGLKALAPGYRRRRFTDTIVQAAGQQGLAVLVDAKLPTKHGGSRSVSVQVTGSRPVFMQAVSAAKSAIDGYDKAQAVFSSADVPSDSLVAVIARQVSLEPWQWQTLSDSGRPLREAELDNYLHQLAS